MIKNRDLGPSPEAAPTVYLTNARARRINDLFVRTKRTLEDLGTTVSRVTSDVVYDANSERAKEGLATCQRLLGRVEELLAEADDVREEAAENPQ